MSDNQNTQGNSPPSVLSLLQQLNKTGGCYGIVGNVVHEYGKSSQIIQQSNTPTVGILANSSYISHEGSTNSTTILPGDDPSSNKAAIGILGGEVVTKRKISTDTPGKDIDEDVRESKKAFKMLPAGTLLPGNYIEYENKATDALITQQGPTDTLRIGRMAMKETNKQGAVSWNQVLPSSEPNSQGITVGKIVGEYINEGTSISTNSNSKEVMATMANALSFMNKIPPNNVDPVANSITSGVSNMSITDGFVQGETDQFSSNPTGDGNSHLQGSKEPNEKTSLLNNNNDRSNGGCLGCLSNCFSNIFSGLSNFCVCFQINVG